MDHRPWTMDYLLLFQLFLHLFWIQARFGFGFAATFGAFAATSVVGRAGAFVA